MTDVKKFGKKLFTLSVVSMTILWSVGVAAFVPAGAAMAANVDAEDIEAGDVVKRVGDTTGALYLITEDMERMYFPNSQTYHTWFEDFSIVKMVDADFDEWWPPASQSVVAPRPGSDLLFKTTASARVYAMSTGNQRLHIADEASAAALYGTNWASKVIDWPDFVMSGWTIAGEEISEPYDGYVASNDGENYEFMDDEWLLIDGDLPDFITPFAYANFDDFSVGSDTVTAASLTEDPSQLGLTPGSVASGSVTIALDANTPDSGYVYKNSTHNPFTKINFTAGDEAVTIDSFVVERDGSPASDAAFTGINVLQEDGTLLSSNYKTINSSHQVTFTEDIDIPANTTVSIMLVGKMANSTVYSGEVPSLQLVSVDTDASVHASFPITGNAMTINTTVTIGAVTVTESPDLSTLTEEVGATDVTFLSVKLDNTSSNNIDLQVDSIRFNNVGSVDDSDIDKLELVADGNVIATSAGMVSNYVTFDLSDVAKAKLLNGKNETFEFRGDIVGGSGRNIDFDIKKVDDIFAKDLLNDAYVTPTIDGNTINGGRIITINPGKLNVSKTNTVQAGNIPEDTSDLKLASWNFKVQGESITVSSINFFIDVTQTGGTLQADDFTGMRLMLGDKALTGTFDGVLNSSSVDGNVTSTDSFTLKEGDNEVVLVGKVNDDATNLDTVQFSIDMSYAAGLDAKGDTTGDTLTVGTYAFPAARVSASLLTVTDLSLNVLTLSTYPAATIAAGSSQKCYSRVAFDATASSEDVQVTAFEFYITTNATAKSNELQNITFYIGGKAANKPLSITKDGTKTDATDEEISVSLSGADQFIVKKGTTVNMDICADLTAGATAGGTHKIDITSTNSNAVTAQGYPSGATVNPAEGTSAGNNMTVGSAGGVVEVSLASDTKVASLMAAGTEVDLAAFKFFATTTEDVELDYVYLTQVVVDTNSSSYLSYDEIWFVNESGVEVPGTRMSPTSTKPLVNFADEAVVVGKDDTNGVVLYLKGKLATIGTCSTTCTGGNGHPDYALGYKVNAAADLVATGHLSGGNTNEYLSSAAAPTGKTHYVYKGYPTFSKVNLTNNLANGTNDLFKFTITAVGNDVSLSQFTFDVVTTGATVTNLYLYDVTNINDELVVNETAGTAPYLVWETDGADWSSTNFANNYILVSPGTPKTLVLRGDVTGAASGTSVTVKLAGDAAHVAGTDTLMHTAAEVDNDANDDFIWSDNSQGAHAVGADDWTNGFLVYGLASTSSTAEITSL